MPAMSRCLYLPTRDPLPHEAKGRHAAVLPRSALSNRSLPSCEAGQWIGIAIFSLLIAGLLSLSVVLGRLPVFSGWINDPLLFKRCLVVHVNLALVVWFYAFLIGLARLSQDGANRWNLPTQYMATLGIGLMLGAALVPGAQPILANYIPVINHPLFLCGLALFFGAVFVNSMIIIAAPRRISGPLALQPEVVTGLRFALGALLLAGATWAATQLWLPGTLEIAIFYEFSAWGAGHVLQVANVCLMLSIWLWACARITRQPVFGARTACWLFSVLVAPHILVPLLSLVPALQPYYISGSTQLMRWAIFPVTLVILGACLRHLWKFRGLKPGDFQRMLITGLYMSMGLTLMGFVLGAMIRGSSTLIPAHYHASLGGVTAALMTAAYLFYSASERSPSLAPNLPSGLARLQLWLFGGGQAMFALGFAIGGVYGLGRKDYTGGEARNLGEVAGLAVMGFGGLVAIAGGVLFLVLAIRSITGRSHTASGCPST